MGTNNRLLGKRIAGYNKIGFLSAFSTSITLEAPSSQVHENSLAPTKYCVRYDKKNYRELAGLDPGIKKLVYVCVSNL